MITLNNLYIQYIDLLVLLGTIGVLFAVVVHYILIGPNGKKLGKIKPEIQRLNMLEVYTHFIRMVSFILLAITGLAFALYKVTSIGLDYQFLLQVHLFSAVMFSLSSLASILMFFKDSIFKKYDWEWIKVMGGYLTRKEVHPPSGKFNAGQKLFYWFSSVLTILIVISGYLLAYPTQYSVYLILGAAIIHGLVAILFIAGVIGHAYLSTFANPGTVGAIIHGKVSKEWAETHHPEWEK